MSAPTFADLYPAYLLPGTGRALLLASRRAIAKRRAEGALRAALRRLGWSDSACGELARIHLSTRGQP